MSCRVSDHVVQLRYSRFGLLSVFGLYCRLLCCAVSLDACCAALLRVVTSGVVLLCAVLFCFALLVPLLAVSCPWALSVANGSCAFWRCVFWSFFAICPLSCVCFAVVFWCVLLFPAVLCALCVLGWDAVHSLSSPLCKISYK